MDTGLAAEAPHRRALSMVEAELAGSGLIVLGTVPVTPRTEDGPAELPGNRVTLIGNAGSAMWSAFLADSGPDGQPDPLDRWVRRLLAPLAESSGLQVVYPSDGPPYWPFIRWAGELPGVSKSPYGPLIHETYGPWFAFRAALLWREDDRHETGTSARPGPCAACSDKPCLDACPSGAITRDAAYDVQTCRGFVATSPDRRCAATGCLARHRCPVGSTYAYVPDHAAFHMDAFSGMAKAGRPK